MLPFAIACGAGCDPIGDDREIAALIFLQDVGQASALMHGTQAECEMAVAVEGSEWSSEVRGCEQWMPWADGVWVEHAFDVWAWEGTAAQPQWTFSDVRRVGWITIEDLTDHVDAEISGGSGSWTGTTTPFDPEDPFGGSHECELTMHIEYPSLPGGPYAGTATVSHSSQGWSSTASSTWEIVPEAGEPCVGAETWGPLCSR